MDDLATPQHHSEAALQQCLAQFSVDLSAKYEDDKQLPKRDGHLLEYLAMRKGGGHCHIGIRSYPEPLTVWELDQQRVLLERIRQTRHTLLATLMDHRLESHGHYIVSGPVGACPLHDYLRQHRSVSFPVVCEFISLLVEALEAAREARWPRCNIEPYSLLLGELSEDSIRKGVCLPVPVLPGLELRKAAATALPATTQVYVPELARLVCQMLGSPQQQRYRPIAKAGAVTNQLLRFVLEQQWQGHLDSARTFAIALKKTAEEGNRVTTGRPSMTDPGPVVLPEATPAVRSSSATTALATATVIMPPPVAPHTALRSLLRPSAVAEGGLTRLRMKPAAGSGKQHARVNLCLGSTLSIGRGAGADHPTRFFPETTKNAERTMMISREHMRLLREGEEIWATEPATVNQSFQGGQPLGGRLRLSSSTRLSVAGHYELEVRKLPSWWPRGQLWEGETLGEASSSTPSGALLLYPSAGCSALDESTVWLHTDAAFGIGEDGIIDLMPTSTRDVIGWFVRAGSAIYIVTAESDGVVRLAGVPLQAQQPCELRPGATLRVGAVDLILATDAAQP